MSDPYVTIILPIEAEGKRAHRSRIAYKDGRPFVATHPDPDTVKHEALISDYARIAMIGKPPLHATAVSIAIEAQYVPPVSWTKAKRAFALSGMMGHMSKPDFDNISKSCCDALKRIVWDDDSRVTMGQVHKVWGYEPQIIISVWRYFEPVVVEPQQGILVGDFD